MDYFRTSIEKMKKNCLSIPENGGRNYKSLSDLIPKKREEKGENSSSAVKGPGKHTLTE